MWDWKRDFHGAWGVGVCWVVVDIIVVVREVRRRRVWEAIVAVVDGDVLVWVRLWVVWIVWDLGGWWFGAHAGAELIMVGVWSSLTLLMSFPSSHSDMDFCKWHASGWMNRFCHQSLW